eukprot:TRINITY_DN14363_c0_g1_i1.p1 TRINITY_DN14363_c0_g1~~TRINITY_DN14363_c0_g1_i1.p1  ORF type:complete len:233 (-),score=15.91 TRINITY_DN14363_c0_g1_i1:125-823(-)
MLSSSIFLSSSGLLESDSRRTRAGNVRQPSRRTQSAPPKVVHSSPPPAPKARVACSPAQILTTMHGQAEAVLRHPHGLQLLQLVVDHGNSHEITELIDELSPVLGDLAMDFRAHPLLCRIIELTDTPYQARQFTMALKMKPFELLISSAAPPILEACVRRFSSHETAFVFEGVCGAAFWLLQHPAGCRLLETCLECMPLGWREKLWTAIASVRAEMLPPTALRFAFRPAPVI